MGQWYRNDSIHKISHVFLWNQSILSFEWLFFVCFGCDCTKRNSTGRLKSDSECSISQMHVVSRNFFPPLYTRPKQSGSWATGRISFRFWNSSITRLLFSGDLKPKHCIVTHHTQWHESITLWKKSGEDRPHHHFIPISCVRYRGWSGPIVM